VFDSLKKFLRFSLVFLFFLNSHVAYGSANNFVWESERLIAYSDSNYTVLATQYEQTHIYSTSKQRLYLRVLDSATNQKLSEILISSMLVDRGEEKPIVESYLPIQDEGALIHDLLEKPQILLDSKQIPKHKFKIDSDGVFIQTDEKQRVLDMNHITARFGEIAQSLVNDDIEFTGWYKARYGVNFKYFVLIKVGLCGCDLDSFEYVISIPDK